MVCRYNKNVAIKEPFGAPSLLLSTHLYLFSLSQEALSETWHRNVSISYIRIYPVAPFWQWHRALTPMAKGNDNPRASQSVAVHQCPKIIQLVLTAHTSDLLKLSNVHLKAKSIFFA